MTCCYCGGSIRSDPVRVTNRLSAHAVCYATDPTHAVNRERTAVKRRRTPRGASGRRTAAEMYASLKILSPSIKGAKL